MVLHGVENAAGFIYRISISFPVELVDSPAAIESYFQRQHAAAVSTNVAASATNQRAN